jgi:hypothetical protein
MDSMKSKTAKVKGVPHFIMMFLHKILKVFVATLGIGEDEEHAIEMPIKPFSRIAAVCKELMDAFWEKRILTQGGFWVDDLGRHQINIQNRLLMISEYFAVAHEVGHFILESSKHEPRERLRATHLVTKFLQGIPDLEPEKKARATAPWTDELSADLIALDIVLSLTNSEPFCRWQEPIRCLYDGVEVFHILLTLVQEYRDRTLFGSKIGLAPTHPHGYLRLNAVRMERKISGVPLGDGFQMSTQCMVFQKYVIEELFGHTASREEQHQHAETPSHYEDT